MIGGGYGVRVGLRQRELPPMYGPYFGGNPYASTPYSAYRPPSYHDFDLVPESRTAGIDAGKPASLGPEPAPQRGPPSGCTSACGLRRPSSRRRASTSRRKATSTCTGSSSSMRTSGIRWPSTRPTIGPSRISDWAIRWLRSVASTRPSSTSNRGSTSIQPGPRTANGWRQSSATTIGSPS